MHPTTTVFGLRFVIAAALVAALFFSVSITRADEAPVEPAQEPVAGVIVSDALPAPELSSDKADYAPGEIATIFGKFFSALQSIVLTVIGALEDGTQTSATWTVTADENGNFTTTYSLPDRYVPLYLVAANSTTGELLAETSFTDAPPACNLTNPTAGTITNPSIGRINVTWGASSASGSIDYQVKYTDGVTTVTHNAVVGTSDNATGLADGTWTVTVRANLTGTCTGSHSSSVVTIGSIPITSVATLRIIKHVINDNGGTATAADFTLDAGGTNDSPDDFAGAESPGTTVTLDAGSYTVTETGPSGYAASFSADCSGSIASGETKTCTVTNDDIQPLLTITKIVVTDNGGTKVVADFPLFVDATGVTSGVQNGFNAGSYTISETGDVDYAATIGGDCAADGSITLTVGDVKSCTITNDDIPGEIHGMKFEDMNGNGVKDVGDNGLPNWVIFLDANSDGTLNNVDGDDTCTVNAAEECTTTDGSGNYNFTGLSVGTYKIREVQQSGWYQTTSNPADIVLDLGDVVTDVDFGNFETVLANGTKKYSGSSVGLGNWTIFADENGNGILDPGEVSDLTDSSGNYTLEINKAGTFTVCEVMTPGWTQTLPTSAPTCGANGFGYTLVVAGSGDGPIDSGNFENKLNPLPPVSIIKKDFQKLSTIPVKFASPADTFAGATLQVCPFGSTIGCANAVSSGSSNVANIFRYDTAAGQYIYNLSTKMAIFTKGTKYDLWVTLPGIGTIKLATIQIKP